jgi:hypothetical protein
VARATRTGTLIWKYGASSAAPASDAISPLGTNGQQEITGTTETNYMMCERPV